MEDQDPTLKLPKHAAPPLEGVSDSQIQNLFAVGAGAFADQPTSPTRGWQPPTVEQLQKALPQYEITALIARGGMGAVYKGTQLTLKRPVAIKVLPPEMEDGDMQFAARFKQEAQSMARLSHPNIVAVFDAGEVRLDQNQGAGEEGRGGRGDAETGQGGTLLYFVMEFIEGTDVAQLIASEGRVEPPRAIQIISAVCEALAFAHEEGIVHRDIKPSNIMIDKRGRVKVADFGLAKTVNLDATLLTGTNLAMGTPDFIAPEAMIPGMKVDGRADLYAVGVMLYQMLTGAIPRGRFGLPSSVIPQMDKGFDAIVDKAMQTDRENRYSTATEMRTDVERISRFVPSSPDTCAQRTNQEIRSTTSRRKPLLLSVGAVILAAGTFLALKQPQDTGPSKATSAATPKSITAPLRPAEFRPAPIVFSPKKVLAPFSLEQWHQLFALHPPPDVWEKFTVYEDGLLFVKSPGGFRNPRQSVDGAIRAVVHLKTAKDTPSLFGRFSEAGGFYQAVWDVERAVFFFAYYATGSGNGYELLSSRAMPPDMTMKVGDVVKLEFRLEGDHLTALTNDKPLLDCRHDKLKTAGAWGIKSLTGAWFENVEIEPIPPSAQRIAEPSRQTEPKPAQIGDSPKRAPSPFSLEQWRQLFPVEKPDAWERLSSYGDGLLYVKANVGFRRSMPSTADGAIRAVVRIKTENDNPMLFGRFSDQRGYYMAFWDVKSSMVGLSYYAIGSYKEYEHLGSRPLPKEMTMRVGDVLRLELRLEGDHIIALTNGMPMLDFRHDKLKAAGEWGIKSLNGAWFESAEIEPIKSP